MKSVSLLAVLFCALCVTAYAADKPAAPAMATSGPEWSLNATAIEACSCTMFCPCYFNTAPSGHHEHGSGEEHYCKNNIAYKVNKGHYGKVDLAGAKFWLHGDLGGDFSKGQMDYAVVTFDKAVTKEQRDGLTVIVGKLFPVKWNSLTVEEGSIDKWEFNKDTAHATLDGGKTAEIILHRPANSMKGQPVVISNLQYWGAPRNDGFVLMPNDVEAYRTGPKAFEFKGTNGFMITIDMNSKDFENAAKGGLQ
ncbi:MAG TPA: DUF1326 domain-containing protein [Acidobacteriota bacterium]|nr:DUF1326 domain-containing protein [Acidobacteriota bacterium]